MKEIFVIGTIHLNWTPRNELEEVLTNLKPDKLFVELAPSELSKSREGNIRDEMFVAYDWAERNKVPVTIFDVEYDVLKEGVTGKETEFIEHELKTKKLLKNYSWKDLNAKEPWQIFEVEKQEKIIFEKYFDKDKSREREDEMLHKIIQKVREGRNVIVTGAGHLNFFEKEIPEAIFPLR